MYNELIDALRYCADYGGYKGCSKCPINANGMVCGTHEDAIAKAADAIERLMDERNQIKDKLIRRICQHCDSVLVGCEGCPVIGEVRAVFDEQST